MDDSENGVTTRRAKRIRDYLTAGASNDAENVDFIVNNDNGMVK